MKKLVFPLALVLAFFSCTLAFASIGVGVGTGKIELDEILRPGLDYSLPPITVINTGDEASEFILTV